MTGVETYLVVFVGYRTVVEIFGDVVAGHGQSVAEATSGWVGAKILGQHHTLFSARTTMICDEMTEVNSGCII